MCRTTSLDQARIRTGKRRLTRPAATGPRTARPTGRSTRGRVAGTDAAGEPLAPADDDGRGRLGGNGARDFRGRRGGLGGQEAAVAAEEAVEQDPDEDDDRRDDEVLRRPLVHLDRPFGGAQRARRGGRCASAPSARGGLGSCSSGRGRGGGSAAGSPRPAPVRSARRRCPRRRPRPHPARPRRLRRRPVRARPSSAGSRARAQAQVRGSGSGAAASVPAPASGSAAQSASTGSARRSAPRSRRVPPAPRPGRPRVDQSSGVVTPRGGLGHRHAGASVPNTRADAVTRRERPEPGAPQGPRRPSRAEERR